MLHCLFLGMAVGIQKGGEWEWRGCVKAGNEKRWVSLVLEGEEGKVKESSQCATEQGTKKQSGAEVRLLHTLVSCEFCGVPLCLWMSF